MIRSIVLLALYLLHTSGDIISKPSSHYSDALKIKCDAVLFRSLYLDRSCYFVIDSERDVSTSSKRCSSVISAAKVAQPAKVPDELWSSLFVDKKSFITDADSAGKTKAMCISENHFNVSGATTLKECATTIHKGANLTARIGEARTCYPSNTTRTPYKSLCQATVETRRGCEVLCDATSQCVGFTYREAGFSSSCVLLQSIPANERRDAAETTVFLKTTDCPARTNITAEFGVDPCIDDIAGMVPIVQKLKTRGICPQIKSNLYVIRAVDANGKRITLDNDKYNFLDWEGGMWVYRFEWGHSLKIPIVAAVCAVAGARKCPCKPLTHITDIGFTPNYPAVPNIVNPCKESMADTPARIYWNLAKIPRGIIHPGGPSDTPHDSITCHAGMWIFWSQFDYNSFGVDGATCFH